MERSSTMELEHGLDRRVMFDQFFQPLDLGVQGFRPLKFRDLHSAGLVEPHAVFCLILQRLNARSCSADFAFDFCDIDFIQ